jgi:hypothetical protein
MFEGGTFETVMREGMMAEIRYPNIHHVAGVARRHAAGISRIGKMKGRRAARHSMIWLLSASALGLVLLRASLSAHEVRPAYLELTQTGADTYEVLWRVPARGMISGSRSTSSSRPGAPVSRRHTAGC